MHQIGPASSATDSQDHGAYQQERQPRAAPHRCDDTATSSAGKTEVLVGTWPDDLDLHILRTKVLDGVEHEAAGEVGSVTRVGSRKDRYPERVYLYDPTTRAREEPTMRTQEGRGLHAQ
jgi:hypothetical protein